MLHHPFGDILREGMSISSLLLMWGEKGGKERRSRPRNAFLHLQKGEGKEGPTFISSNSPTRKGFLFPAQKKGGGGQSSACGTKSKEKGRPFSPQAPAKRGEGKKRPPTLRLPLSNARERSLGGKTAHRGQKRRRKKSDTRATSPMDSHPARGEGGKGENRMFDRSHMSGLGTKDLRRGEGKEGSSYLTGHYRDEVDSSIPAALDYGRKGEEKKKKVRPELFLLSCSAGEYTKSEVCFYLRALRERGKGAYACGLRAQHSHGKGGRSCEH